MAVLKITKDYEVDLLISAETPIHFYGSKLITPSDKAKTFMSVINLKMTGELTVQVNFISLNRKVPQSLISISYVIKNKFR